eukprot:7077828-Heterocapsa_arctica.AAC.1
MTNPCLDTVLGCICGCGTAPSILTSIGPPIYSGSRVSRMSTLLKPILERFPFDADRSVTPKAPKVTLSHP